MTNLNKYSVPDLVQLFEQAAEGHGHNYLDRETFQECFEQLVDSSAQSQSEMAYTRTIIDQLFNTFGEIAMNISTSPPFSEQNPPLPLIIQMLMAMVSSISRS